jgi:hypothetical protein
LKRLNNLRIVQSVGGYNCRDLDFRLEVQFVLFRSFPPLSSLRKENTYSDVSLNDINYFDLKEDEKCISLHNKIFIQ